MQETKSLLNSAEVDFLMEVGESPATERSEGQAAKDTQVTMRGDLERINLADIFQTLAMSKMEGLLRVRNPLEQREVYFRDGFVRILVPPRLEKRRLGQRLVKAGLLTPESLRSALLEQAKEKVTLGNLLVERGYVSAQEVEEIALLQITEDLFSLFTWQHGKFEFYRGSCPDPLLARQLENCPEFEIDSLLLEVARRSDEWDGILKVLRNLDEIPVVLESRFELEEGQLTDTHQAVMDAIDGQRTYREVADAALLSLFEAARCAKDLLEWHQIEVADTTHCLQVAEQYLDQGDTRRAVMTLQTLCDRKQEYDLEIVGTIAELLKRGGESRLAGRTLLEAAQLQVDPDLSLELARQARILSSRDIDILRFLRSTLVSHEGVDREEAETVTLELADALLDADQFEETQEVLAEAEEAYPGSAPVLLRKARMLHRRKQPKEAVEALLRIAAIYDESNQREKLAEIYEQILKIDPEQKDAAKSLRRLRTRKLLKRRTVIAGAAAIVCMLAAAVYLWRTASFHSRLSDARTEINALLDRNDPTAAAAALQQFVTELGQHPELQDLQQRIQFAKAEEANRARREAKRRRAEQMGLAADHLGSGRFDAAFAIYDELHSEPEGRVEIVEVVNTRLSGLADDLKRLGKELPFYIPESPGKLVDPKKVQRVLEELRHNFTEEDRLLVEGVLEAHANGGFPAYCDGEVVARLAAEAKETREILAKGKASIEEYEAAARRLENQDRLTPLFEAAKRYEKEQDFDKALKCYIELEKEFTGDRDLKAHFRDMVEKYATITTYLGVIETATRKGDFATAQSQYRALKLAYPDIEFDRVRLPLRVESRPTGARVLVNGKPRGRTPLLLHYTPGEEMELVVQMEGFVTESAHIAGDRVGLVKSLLALTPSWQTKLNGPVTHAGVIDSEDRLFVTDRAGSLHVFQLDTGTPLWQTQFNDLNGFHPSPVLFQDKVIVASLDGQLRCLDRATGKPVWQLDGLATEVGLALCESWLMVSTVDGRLVAVDPRVGKVVRETRLSQQALSDLVALGPNVLVSSEGRLTAMSCPDGRVLWRAQVGPGLLSRACVTTSGIAVTAEDGTVMLLDSESGTTIWQTPGLGNSSMAPVAAQSNLVVADRGKVHLVRIADGKVVAAVASQGSEFSSAPARVGDRIIVGQRDGHALVLDSASLELMYQVRGSGSLVAPAASGSGRDLVLGFDSKQLMVFRTIP